MTLSKRPYMIDAMRCENFVGYLGCPGLPSCRRSTSGGCYGRAGLDANRDVRFNNAQISDSGLEEARTVCDEQASHSAQLLTPDWLVLIACEGACSLQSSAAGPPEPSESSYGREGISKVAMISRVKSRAVERLPRFVDGLLVGR